MSTCPNCNSKILKEDAVFSYGKNFVVHTFSCSKCNSKFRDYFLQKDKTFSFTLIQQNGKGRFKKSIRKK